METRIRLTGTRGEGGRIRGKDGEGSNQQTGVNDPWAWITRWGLTVGGGVGGAGESKGIIGPNTHTYTILKKFNRVKAIALK